MSGIEGVLFSRGDEGGFVCGVAVEGTRERANARVSMQ